MLRAAVKAGTPLGLEAKAVMERGELVSDAIVSGLIGEALDQLPPSAGIIFDGYPRTDAQARALDTLLPRYGIDYGPRALDFAQVYALVDRITGRFSCANCGANYHDRYKLPKVEGTCDVCGSHDFKRRPDDNEETVRTRMTEYRAKTAPILPIYEARGIVSRVDVMLDIDQVTAAIERIIAG
jgi:adenylate kinase